jgi:hypothetical protein
VLPGGGAALRLAPVSLAGGKLPIGPVFVPVVPGLLLIAEPVPGGVEPK